MTIRSKVLHRAKVTLRAKVSRRANSDAVLKSHSLLKWRRAKESLLAKVSFRAKLSLRAKVTPCFSDLFPVSNIYTWQEFLLQYSFTKKLLFKKKTIMTMLRKFSYANKTGENIIRWCQIYKKK